MRKIKEITVQHIENYTHHLYEEGRSKSTIEKYKRSVLRFMAYSQDHGKPDKACVRAWRDSLVEEGYSASTVNVMLSAVTGLMKFLGLPHVQVPMLKVQRKVFRSSEKDLTREEYMRLLRTAQGLGNTQMMLVMETICATGIRVSELEHITVEAVLDGRADVTCKGKERTILIPRKLRSRLRKWINKRHLTTGSIFVTRGGLPLDRSYIWREMKRLSEAAGVAPGKVYPHNLRHLFARMFYAVGKDIVKLADVLGHSSIITTRLYVMETGEEHERMISRLDLVI